MKFSKLGIVAVLAVIGAYIRAIFFTPSDVLQGSVQKIFYVHVASGFIGLYLGFGLVFVASVLYLWLRDPKLDRVASSSAEVGFVFTSVVLITGPLWGRPVWGTYWTWDAKLTLTLFLWFIFAAYMILRGAVDDFEMRARFSAVLGILGALLVPFIHLSVYFFRTLHPMPLILKPSAPSVSREMLITISAWLCAFILLYAWLLRERYLLAVDRDAAMEGVA